MVSIRSLGRRIKLMCRNPGDFRLLKFDNRCCSYGIVLVSHESNNLGASILLMHIASELAQQGRNIYIISKHFGVLNKQFCKIAPTQVTATRKSFKKTINKLHKKGYTKILFNTVVCGDLVKIAKDEGFKTVSLIHELAQVITSISKEEETRQMLKYSDRVVFSTDVAKKEVLNLTGMPDNPYIIIKPQGTYFKKPDADIIDSEVKKLKEKYHTENYNGVVVGVGNTTERKGFDLFVMTAASVPDTLFFWAGNKEAFYHQVIKQMEDKLPENFVYLGSLNQYQLAGLYSVASVLLMSSRKDTLPSIIMEALLFGVPVIGSADSGGITDIINENNGYLTESASVELFSASIRDLLNDNKINKLKTWIRSNPEKCNYSFSEYVIFLESIFSQI